MEKKQLTQEQIDLLNKPLPDEAVSQHPTRKYLSSIKGIYVTERLNEVFGIGGWIQRNEIVSKGEIPEFSEDGKPLPKMIVLHSFLTMPEYGIELDNFGGNDNVDEGDAFKGAATDALTKMASYIGIGKDVYKGLYKDGVYQGNKVAQKPSYSPKPTPLVTKNGYADGGSYSKTTPQSIKDPLGYAGSPKPANAVSVRNPVLAPPVVPSETLVSHFSNRISTAKSLEDLDVVAVAIKLSNDLSVPEKSMLRGKYKSRKDMLTPVKSEPATLKDYEQNGFMPEEK